MAKHWTQSFAEAVADARHKVLEEGWFGKAVTPRAQTITIGSTPDDLTPAERLGWSKREDHAPASPAEQPERGIDL